MIATQNERSKLKTRLEDIFSWRLSCDLFGDVGVIINDFEKDNYIYFLDNVKSLEDLLEGLRQLSPLADDALEVAENMNHQNFYKFKIALIYERRQEDSKMPDRYLALVIPRWFMYALPWAEKYGVPLGNVTIRLMELEEHN